MSAPVWRPGDRVALTPTGDGRDFVQGTVREVDEDGVTVDMDREIRGTTWCWALPEELTRMDGGS